MRVIISAGGTGGHIYPALAIINKIKEHNKDAEFLYIGTTTRMEKDIIPKYNIKYIPITIYGLSKYKVSIFFALCGGLCDLRFDLFCDSFFDGVCERGIYSRRGGSYRRFFTGNGWRNARFHTLLVCRKPGYLS